MDTQLQKYLNFNVSRPSTKQDSSITFLPVQKTSQACVYYDGTNHHTERTNSHRSVLSEMTSHMSANNSFRQLINPPLTKPQCYSRFPIKMHRCVQPIKREAEKRQAIEQKRFEVECLRRSLSQRKILLQSKYDDLMGRVISIRQFYEQHKAVFK